MMKKVSDQVLIENEYTDSPALHPNFFLGSLHILVWFFFHPTAWRNYIRRLDATLPANFTLAELNQHQWRNRHLRRLLLQGYLVWVLWFGVTIILNSWLSPAVDGIDMAALAFGVIGVVVGSLAISTVVSVAVGMVFIATSGIISLLGSGLANHMPDWGPFTLEALLLSVWVGLVGYVAGTLAESEAKPSLGRQIGSVVVGVIISSLLLQIVLTIIAGASALTETGATFALTLAGVFTLIIAASFGLAIRWRTSNWRRAIWGSLAAFVIIGLGGSIILSIAANTVEVENLFMALVGGAMGLAIGFLFCTMFALPYLLAEKVAGPWAGAVAGILGSCGVYIGFSIYVGGYTLSPIVPLFVGIMLLCLGLGWWRPVLTYPLQAAWHLLLFRADQRRLISRTGQATAYLRWHAAFWDEQQWLPWTGLDDHLVLIAESNEISGQKAMHYLSAGPQRRFVQAAQIELEARRLANCPNGKAIAQAHQRLGTNDFIGPAGTLLRSFSRLSQDVEAALQQASHYNQRLALSAVEDRLDSLFRELTRSSEPYATRFQPIAAQWRKTIAADIKTLADVVEDQQEIDNPYIIGVPLTEQQEIFVGRTEISRRIEQLLLDRRRPPLLLYGQRRMGKTSLLHNLGRLLPSTIVPLFVDLQGPASRAQDHAGFLYNMARSMRESALHQRNLTLPNLSRDALAPDPFTIFDEWLDSVEEALDASEQHTALLALDEFETLEAPFNSGHFSQSAVLGMFRHLIQHRPRFKVLLTGSHTLDELQHWASYLINVQTLHVGYLAEAEAKQLIESPTPDFNLRYEPSACQHILDLTRGHPALLQLLCAEIVALKNEQPLAQRRWATIADVEAAIPEALTHGSFFFSDIERNQLAEAEVAILKLIAQQGANGSLSQTDLAREFGSPEQLQSSLKVLQQRELIECINGNYHFQVALIQRWFSGEY